MSDIEIPEEAVEAGVTAVLRKYDTPSDSITEDLVRDDVRAALQAALPALRRQWAEEVAKLIEALPEVYGDGWPLRAYEVKSDAVGAVREYGQGVRATAVHKPFPDDGVTYCGWATGTKIVDGCGEVWPCAHVREFGEAK